MPRIACTIEEFADCYADVTDNWTRAEWRQLTEADNAGFWELFHRKVRAVFLRTVDGAEITDPAAVTDETLDRMDLRLVGFVGGVLPDACLYLRSLGNASGRASSDSNGKK